MVNTASAGVSLIWADRLQSLSLGGRPKNSYWRGCRISLFHSNTFLEGDLTTTKYEQGEHYDHASQVSIWIFDQKEAYSE